MLSSNESLCCAVRFLCTLLQLQVYVQDLIQANGAKLWPLFEAGAIVYVCGDARRMVSGGATVTVYRDCVFGSSQLCRVIPSQVSGGRVLLDKRIQRPAALYEY